MKTNEQLIESLQYHTYLLEEKSNGKKIAMGAAGGALIGAGTGALKGGQKQVDKINNRVHKYVNKKGGNLIGGKIHYVPTTPGEILTGKTASGQTIQQKVNAIGKGAQKMVRRTKGLINKASLKGGLKGAAIGAGIGALAGAAALKKK